MDIAEFVSVPVREVWKHEASDFTNWLAEHPKYLSDALGLDVEIEQTEADVGAFRVDMLARETGTGQRIIVENQLEPANHAHLGQLLTYAAGLEADYVVWIATRIRPEYRSALRWLNEQSKEGVGFFGLEVEAVGLGTSAPVGIRLNAVVAPDTWSKEVPDPAALSPRRALYLEFWTEFLDALHKRYPGWSRAQKPQAQSWFASLPAGRTGISYSVNFTGDKNIRAELYVDPYDPELHETAFADLEKHRAQIEAAFGDALSWEPLESKHASRIAYYASGTVDNRDAWPTIREWMLDQVGKLRSAVQQFVDQL